MLLEPIQKAPVIYISGNTVLLDIDGVVPAWDVYTFSMDVQEPGQKQMILHVKKDAIEKRSVQTQTEDLENKEVSEVDSEMQSDSTQRRSGKPPGDHHYQRRTQGYDQA
ncbi:hypothetical protein BDN67DRAFT_1017432 [Paxillus ammoniavirescens]|nr:hypothetical protein BDN67DRAFT_1017432 [Paxillus ammoniavirescens]